MLSLVRVTGCQRDTEGAGRKQAPSLARPGQARARQEGWAHRPGSDSWGVPQGTSQPPSVPRLRVSSGLWVTGHPVTRGLGDPVSRPQADRTGRGYSQRHLHKPGQQTGEDFALDRQRVGPGSAYISLTAPSPARPAGYWTVSTLHCLGWELGSSGPSQG